jgi:hypothetical protein
MSYEIIRKLLEQRLNTITPALATVFENMPYTPVKGTPWQAVHMLPAPTENPTMGDQHHREVGEFQVSLNYPPMAGSQAANARAQLIREAFPRGLTLTEGTLRVLIDRTPYVLRAQQSDSWFFLAVAVPYMAEVFTS